MYNVIPRFICSAFEQQLAKGCFPGSVLYVDINNFTNLADNLKKFDLEGTEQLSVILNKIFEKLIKRIYQEEGFVSNFAGDSLTVIFKNIKIDKALPISRKIRDVFVNNRIIKTEFGNFNLSARFGLSYGKILWGIVGSEDKFTYYFKGTPINKAVKISNQSKNFSVEFLKKNIPHRVIERPKILNVNQIIKPQTAKKFFPASIVKYPYSGEFREVISVFIGFPETESFTSINKFSSKLFDLSRLYDGYVNSLEFSDKGPLFLVFFGAPTSSENNLNHALDFSLELKRTLPGVFKISISAGTVYAGILGSKQRCTYTILGDVVNHAAKVIQRISFDEIVVTSSVFNRSKNYYHYSERSPMSIKGKKKNLKAYNLNHRFTKIKDYRSRNKIVGRDKELNKILSFLKFSTASNSSKIVVITGEPGIGKTRVCQEIENNLKTDCLFFNLRGDEVRDDSFFMFKVFFKNYFNISDLNDNENNLKQFHLQWEKIDCGNLDKQSFLYQEYFRTKPILANLIGLEQPDIDIFTKLDPKIKYLNIVSAVKSFFRVISNQLPLMIIFDDIQWMDRDSRKLMEELMINIEDFPINFIICYRPDLKINSTYFKIPDNYQILKIYLNKLPVQGILELSKQIFKKPTDHKLLDFLIEKSNGNPFYFLQYCYYLMENSLLQTGGRRISLNSENFSIPPTIREILIARIDRLSDHLKELIKNAAVLGLEFDINILSTMLDKKFTREILKEGEQEKLIQSLTELIYIFQHAIIRETVYTMQLKSQLEKLHFKAAKCIENVYPDDGENYYNIAYHYYKANLPDIANKYYLLAANYSTENYQNQQAINCYQNILKSTKSKIDQIDLKLKIADIYHQMGSWDKSKDCYFECLNSSILAKHKKYQAISYFGLGWVFFRIDYNKSIEYFEKSIQLVKSTKVDNYFYLRLLGSYGLALLKIGRIEQSKEYYQKQLKLSEKLNDQNNIGKAIEGLGSISWREGNLELAKNYFNQSLKIFERIGAIIDLQPIYSNLGSIYFSDSEYDDAMHYYDKLLKLTIKIGNKNGIAVAYNNIGNIHAIKNDYREALKYYQKRLEISRENADLKGISLTQGNIGSILYHLGHYQQALNAYQEMRSSCQKIGDLRLVGLALANIARVRIYFGQYHEARKLIIQKFLIDKQLNYKQGLAKAFGEMGLINFHLGYYNQAVIANLRRLKLLQDMKNKLEISQCHQDLANIFIEAGKLDKAAEHLKSAETILLEKKIKLNLAELYYLKALLNFKQQDYQLSLDFLKKSSQLLNQLKLYHCKLKNDLLRLMIYLQENQSKVMKLVEKTEKQYKLTTADKILIEFIKYKQSGDKNSSTRIKAMIEKHQKNIPYNLKQQIRNDLN